MADDPRLGGDRLDSWKAIAAYLKRDESTVRRWERELGLPVRRVNGGRRSSVFAYASELDAWLRSQASVPNAASTRYPRSWAAAVILSGALAGVGWWALDSSGEPPASVHATPDAIVALDATGREVWRASSAPNERVIFDSISRASMVEVLLGTDSILVASAYRIHTPTNAELSGQLTQFSTFGARRRVFELSDAVRFGGSEYESPWALVDYRLSDPAGGGRVAIAAHHYLWWPGLVTVLDENWERLGSFVNPGWTERVHWLTSDRLVVAGFSEARDGGMVALLDAESLDGQAPEEPTGRFYCGSCGPGRPLRYVVMPRSEINRVSGSRFNRAKLEISGERLLVRTVETVLEDGSGVDVLYEFSPELELLGASFSARYWDVHRSLEADGKLDHSQEQCSDRNGPGAVSVWTPHGGWTTMEPR